MSAPSRTKVFGIALPFDPKYLFVGLLALAGIVYYANSDSSGGAPSTSDRGATAAPSGGPAPLVRSRTRTARRGNGQDRGILRFKTVDGSDGRIDPTLRLDLLSRLQTVEPIGGGRSLFEAGAAEVPNVPPAPVQPVRTAPVVQAPPQPVVQSQPARPVANIPFHFYGFVNPARKSETARGLFLNGDNVVVAAEGDVISGRYLVVELSPNHARVEDTYIKQGQTLPVVPAGQE